MRPPLAALLLASLQIPSPVAPSPAPAEAPPPAALCEVEEVVDGDTLHVWREGVLTKLRLLSVDTEEKLAGRPAANPSKPETVFGHETMLWAQELFRGLAPAGERPRVALRFPPGPEQTDVYGRLLCHVVLPDGRDLGGRDLGGRDLGGRDLGGRDFNLMLVELGKSPYFTKYGNSELCHAEFAAAQERAREKRLGIWNPATNAAATPGAPSAARPYERLLPWWNRRAEAIERFRKLRAESPLENVDAQVPAELEAALARARPVNVFGTLDRLFDEQGGDWTLLFSASEGAPALRVRIPAERRAAFESLDLAQSREEYRQNYLWVRGTLARNGRGFSMRCGDPSAIRIAEPH